MYVNICLVCLFFFVILIWNIQVWNFSYYKDLCLQVTPLSVSHTQQLLLSSTRPIILSLSLSHCVSLSCCQPDWVNDIPKRFTNSNEFECDPPQLIEALRCPISIDDLLTSAHKNYATLHTETTKWCSHGQLLQQLIQQQLQLPGNAISFVRPGSRGNKSRAY